MCGAFQRVLDLFSLFSALEEAGCHSLQPDTDACNTAQGDGSNRHLTQQKDTRKAKENMRRPDSDDRMQFPLLRQRHANGREKVVEEYQNDGENEARALAASA